MALLRRFARRPIGALVLGYLAAAAVLAGGVAWQSGVDPGVFALFANFLLLSPAVGLAWGAGRVLARRLAPEPWWRARVIEHGVGLVAIVLLGAAPLVYVVTVVADHPADGIPPRVLIPWFLGILAAVNVGALTTALGMEAWGRRADG